MTVTTGSMAEGAEITVEYDRHWKNHPAHWESSPAKTFEVTGIRGRVVKLCDKNGEKYRLHPDGDLYVVCEKPNPRSYITGINAEVQD